MLAGYRDMLSNASCRYFTIKVNLSLQEDFEDAMKGVVCDTHPGVRDEAPQAYKSLETVMSDQ